MKASFFDGHVHSPYCPHGSSAAFSEYIESLVSHGYTGVTFCEHAPLPDGFLDPVPAKDSAMSHETLVDYLTELKKIQYEYRAKLDIRIGLEVDFIEGYEKETTEFLNEFGPLLDDSILSVHFVKTNDHHHCIDFSADAFQAYSEAAGSFQRALDRYYETVQRSIFTDIGVYKPNRIGHPSLVRKFQKRFPLPEDSTWLRNILSYVQEKKMSIDANGAGVLKPDCGEPYPPVSFLKEASDLGIPLVYGSDAHHPNGLHQGRDELFGLNFSVPRL